MDPAGVLQLVNKPLLDYTGLSLEELQDWANFDIVHPDDRPRVTGCLEALDRDWVFAGQRTSCPTCRRRLPLVSSARPSIAGRGRHHPPLVCPVERHRRPEECGGGAAPDAGAAVAGGTDRDGGRARGLDRARGQSTARGRRGEWARLPAVAVGHAPQSRKGRRGGRPDRARRQGRRGGGAAGPVSVQARRR